MQVIPGWSTSRSTTCFFMPGNEVCFLKMQFCPAYYQNLQICSSCCSTMPDVVAACRLLPCCYTHASVCGARGHGCHIHCNFLFLWFALVGHIAVSQTVLACCILLLTCVQNAACQTGCKVLAMCCQPPSTNAVFCSKDGDCVTNNNNQTGFVTALIFSVVTEQTIGEQLLKVVVACCCCHAVPITRETTPVVLQVCSSKVCILQAMVTHIQMNAGQLHG